MLSASGEKDCPLERGLELYSFLIGNILSCAGEYALFGHDQ